MNMLARNTLRIFWGVLFFGYVQLESEVVSRSNVSFLERLEEDIFSNILVPFVETKYVFSFVGEYVGILLYTNTHPNQSYNLTLENIENAPFTPSVPTVTIVHGWHGNASESWIAEMKDEYFAYGEYNILVVHWAYLAGFPYVPSALHTRLVGVYLGIMLTNLITLDKLSADKVQLVGFSLGAHVVGFAGKTVTAQKGIRLGRITGLDPAGPLFGSPIEVVPELRLASTDAQFVDIIHTCAGRLGINEEIGQVDFYPNGGDSPQPGCDGPNPPYCSHGRSHSYYTESIRSDKFRATKCNSWPAYKEGKCKSGFVQLMGFHASPTNPGGRYYLYTNENPPYGQG